MTTATKINPARDEVLAALREATRPLSALDVAEAVAKKRGHDTSWNGKFDGSGYDTYAGYLGSLIATGTVRRLIEELVNAGEAVAVKANDQAGYGFSYFRNGLKTAYIGRELFDTRVRERQVAALTNRRKALRRQAEQIVLERHEDEVLAELERLIAEEERERS